MNEVLTKENLLIAYKVVVELENSVKPSLHNQVVTVKNEIANQIVKVELNKE